MTQKQEKLIENYIRLKVRNLMNEKKSLKEEEGQPQFAIYKRQVNPNGLVHLITYLDESFAKKVVQILNQGSDLEDRTGKMKNSYILKVE